MDPHVLRLCAYCAVRSGAARVRVSALRAFCVLCSVFCAPACVLCCVMRVVLCVECSMVLVSLYTLT